MEQTGLTSCRENIKGFLGIISKFRKTNNTGKLCALFDISFGIGDLAQRKFTTWRHCIAYGENAEIIQTCKTGEYLELSGWITTNPILDVDGKITYVDGKPVTKEYLIVENVFKLKRNMSESYKQLSLVGRG